MTCDECQQSRTTICTIGAFAVFGSRAVPVSGFGKRRPEPTKIISKVGESCPPLVFVLWSSYLILRRPRPFSTRRANGDSFTELESCCLGCACRAAGISRNLVHGYSTTATEDCTKSPGHAKTGSNIGLSFLANINAEDITKCTVLATSDILNTRYLR